MLFIEKKLIHMCRKYMDVFLRNGVIKPKCKFKKYNRRSVKKSQWPYWQTINFCSCLNLILHLILLSVQFSCSVVSDSLWPHESQHTRNPCPSLTPRVHPTHVHQVSDAIQPSHPLSFPSPPALNPSQHQSLFQWDNSSHNVAKVLEFQL